MSRPGRIRRWLRTTAMLAPLVGAAALAATGPEDPAGGIRLAISTGLRAAVQDNRALDPVSAGSSSEVVAPLAFTLSSETRNTQLSMGLGGDLGFVDVAGAPGGTAGGIHNPYATLSYRRTGARAQLDLDATIRERDLTLGEARDADGAQTVTGTATQQRRVVSAGLKWNTDGRVSYGLKATLSDTDYRGGTATGLGGAALSDSRRETIALSSRLALTPATDLTLGLSWSGFSTEAAPDRRETVGFDVGVVVDRPLGKVTANLGLEDTEAGERVSFSVGRVLDLSDGHQLDGRIGATRGVDGEVHLTAALSAAHDLSRGVLSYGIERDVRSSDVDDSERLNTSLAVSYAYALSTLSQLHFEADYVRTEATQSGLTSASTTLGARYDRSLNTDWTMSLGYRHRQRDQDGQARARSNAVFLEVNRDFVTRF